MHIASVILKDFAPFVDSAIKEIDVTFTEKVQIVIGSNGAGKSQFLKQLSPYPPTRGMFEEKKGFKSLVVQKNGIYYRLDSEYEKPSSPHLFHEGDSEENLNIGRTTGTQHELIVEHLGITPLVDDLIMNRLVFPKMTPARRKEFLMGANPDQIGFVLGLVKLISSKIKACRNNLARLSERKILLEQQLVDDETLASINEEKALISEDLGHFQQNLMNIEIGLRTVGPIQQISIGDLASVRQVVKRSHYQLSTLSHINRQDRSRQQDRENTLSSLAVCKQQLQEKEQEIVTLSDQLIEMETRYREIAVDGDLEQIDMTIGRLELERDRLHIARPPFELSTEDLEQRYQELDTLRERLLKFVDLPVALLPSKKRQRRERVLQSSQYKQSRWEMRLSDLATQHEELSRRHNLKPSDIPDSPCAKDACPLYSHFMGEYQHTEQKRQSIQLSLDKGKRKIGRLNNFIGGLQTYFDLARPYHDEIQWLVGYAQSNPVLHHILRQLDILSVLSSNPNRIGQLLQEAYGRIDQWLKLKAVLSDLETAHALKSRQISSESHDTIKLVSLIDQTKKTIYELRSETCGLVEKHQQLDKLLGEIQRFNEIKETILSIQDQHQQMMHALANGYEKDRLDLLRRGVEELRARHFLRMSEIEKTIRAQSGLRERYEEEVLSQIGLIDQELADLQQIEPALIAIPKENMIGFINNVFEQANRLIESIWTIPLKIEPLKLDDSLTYEFTVSGDNDSLRELGECSEGQTEVLSLAINLALRIVLQHFDFPLCLDETGRTFQEKHRQNLIVLLKRLLDDKVISQLFFISHDAMLYDSFSLSETLVLRDENITVPQTYNLHVTMK